MEQFDWSSMTLVGLAIIGTVNAVTMFKPKLESKWKFVISVVVALAISFIPADLGSVVLDKLVVALTAATASSGVYKLTTKLGDSE